MKKWILLVALGCFAWLLAGASSCQVRRCQISADCPGKQICGPGGKCVPRCKTRTDCHDDERCVEGVCKKIQ
jgi:hypothetical protein